MIKPPLRIDPQKNYMATLHCEVMLIHTVGVMVVAGIGASSYFCDAKGSHYLQLLWPFASGAPE